MDASGTSGHTTVETFRVNYYCPALGHKVPGIVLRKTTASNEKAGETLFGALLCTFFVEFPETTFEKCAKIARYSRARVF